MCGQPACRLMWNLTSYPKHNELLGVEIVVFQRLWSIQEGHDTLVWASMLAG